MTYRTRSPYAVLPRSDVRRYLWPHRQEIADAYARHGEHGLGVVLRDLVRPRFTARAGHPAEVRLLREALAVEVEDGVAYWSATLDGRDPDAEDQADRVREYAAAEDLTPERERDLADAVRARFESRADRGDAFHVCPTCRSTFAPQRARPADDGLVYCRRCSARARSRRYASARRARAA